MLVKVPPLVDERGDAASREDRTAEGVVHRVHTALPADLHLVVLADDLGRRPTEAQACERG